MGAWNDWNFRDTTGTYGSYPHGPKRIYVFADGHVSRYTGPEYTLQVYPYRSKAYPTYH
ncbi:MAG: hypothetical protein K9N51_09410 [Candidatus Pacebacteria bacterium]|nr:hypothetical protein [Candidatus Paceibacterota bacterium]